MKTSILFLSFIIPLYILDQVTKWWCVLHFHDRQLKPVFNKEGELLGQEPVWYNAAGQWKVDIIPELFWLPRVHNTGVAWGMGNGTAWAPIVFLIIPIVALGVIYFLWKKNFFILKPARYAAPLLVAGIFGNLTDRLTQGFFLEHLKDESLWTRFSSGYVVDFLAVKIPIIDYNFPVFNVADSCVSTAATLLLFTALFEKKLSYKQGIAL